ncbi:MAG: hypothetical protein EB127_05495 [Alphaproteobacteria bacterium]|nr:hypothetical protein [Alphaproteobacteria bacterium]
MTDNNDFIFECPFCGMTLNNFDEHSCDPDVIVKNTDMEDEIELEQFAQLIHVESLYRGPGMW